jgi:hypothetical protein
MHGWVDIQRYDVNARCSYVMNWKRLCGSAVKVITVVLWMVLSSERYGGLPVISFSSLYDNVEEGKKAVISYQALPCVRTHKRQQSLLKSS